MRWANNQVSAKQRQTWTARNYEDETPESAEPDKDQIVRYAYTDGLRTTYTADLPSDLPRHTVGGSYVGNLPEPGFS